VSLPERFSATLSPRRRGPALGLNLPFEALGEYFFGGLLVMFVFIFVARPITVLACLLPDRRSGWTGREMAFISWCRETGVIPAAVASLLL
jgi:potassium/hydrogen antiporter